LEFARNTTRTTGFILKAMQISLQVVRRLFRLWLRGAKRSFPVVSVLLLIGILISAWLAAGTVPALVYYGTKLIHPRYFIVSAFLLTAVVSTLMGTSFGAAGTMGLALMIMARGSQMPNLDAVAGAIIAGAYVGDRCSPMSSSAHLVAILTRTKLYGNLKYMLTTAWVPLVISTMLYGVLSWFNPLEQVNQTVSVAIATTFNLNGVTLLPAIAIILLAIIRLDTKVTMLVSLGIATLLSLGLQHYSPIEYLKYLWLGFHIDNNPVLEPMLQGGGMLSMLKISAIVIGSTGGAELLSATQALKRLEQWLLHFQTHRSRFMATSLVSTGAAALGCTQTIAILLTHQLVQKHYKNPYRLAIELENSAVLLSPLIPWNIAGLVPATVLMVGPGFIPYAIYLYLVPLWYWLRPSPLTPLPIEPPEKMFKPS
jgi:Na+:H+ antiporter, NhaC family